MNWSYKLHALKISPYHFFHNYLTQTWVLVCLLIFTAIFTGLALVNIYIGGYLSLIIASIALAILTTTLCAIGVLVNYQDRVADFGPMT